MNSYSRPSSSSQSRPSGRPNQQRHEPPRQPQETSTGTPYNTSNIRSTETTIIVLSDSESEKEPPRSPASVIEIDSETDTEERVPQLEESTRPNPTLNLLLNPLTATRASAPSLPFQRGEGTASARISRPLTDLQNRNALRPDRGATAQEYPGFWDTGLAIAHQRPQSKAFPDTQPQTQRPQAQVLPASQAQRPQPQVSRASPSQRPQPESPQPQGPGPDSSNGLRPISSNSATTSSFPTAFKQYTPANIQSGRNIEPLNEKVPSPAPTPEGSTLTAKISVCNNCTHGELQCDGVLPACTLCKERGMACSYQAEMGPAEKSKLVVKLKVSSPGKSPGTERAKSTNSRHEPALGGSPQNHQLGHDPVSTSVSGPVQATKAKIVLRPPRPQVSVREEQTGAADQQVQKNGLAKEQIHDSVDTESTASGEYQQFDNASVSSETSDSPGGPIEIDPTPEAFKSLMEGLRKELYAWQEVSVQAELRQAIVDVRTQPGPKRDPTLPDPFRAITEQRRSAGNVLQDSRLELDSSAKARPQNKKLMVIRAPPSSFSTGATVLPKYKAIGRVSSSILAPNYHTAKYWAYDAEDETEDPDASRKYEDFKSHYNTDFDSLKEQRQCQELVWLWKPWIEGLFTRLQLRKSDVLYFFTFSNFEPLRRVNFGGEQWKSCRKCGLADPKSRQSYFCKETLEALPRPDDRSLGFAALLACAFHDIAGVSLWHIAVGGLHQPRYEVGKAKTARNSGLCLICFRHQCPDHGSYHEPNEELGIKTTTKPFVNDSEQSSNIRRFVSLPSHKPQDKSKIHLCGVFCVQPSSKLRQIIGRQFNGTISGDSRQPEKYIRPILADDQLCGSSCFWDVNNRRDIKASEVKFQPFLSASQKVLVEKLMPFYLNNQRGPCLISRIIKDVGCLMVFNHIMFAIFDIPHPEEAPGAVSDSSTAQRGSNQIHKKKKAMASMDVSKSADLGIRPPFCLVLMKDHVTTTRRALVPAVRCIVNDFVDATNLVNDVSVVAHAQLAAKRFALKTADCGVVEVLESSNKYRDDIRIGRCKNNRIQLGLPAHTTKAPSQVQGYGLYSRAEIPMGDFIGEYTGEVISRSEGNRRGTIYHLINQEYLFNLNRGQEIDASNNGNKMRFMNNSQREENINVEAKSSLCSGVVRIGLFAKRDIRAGEELLWKYGYSAELVKYFWEPGEKPATARAVIPFSKERLARNTGRNRLAGETSRDSRENSSQSPVLHRRRKRKRSVAESPEEERQRAVEDNPEEAAEALSDEIPGAPEMDDSEDSDYSENNGHVSEDADVDEDLDEESDLDTLQGAKGRRNGSTSDTAGGGRSDVASGGAPSSSELLGGSKSEQRQHAADAGKKQSTGQKDLNSVTMLNSNEVAKRKRKIRPDDKRRGGKAQQQAWETRRLNSMGSEGKSQ